MFSDIFDKSGERLKKTMELSFENLCLSAFVSYENIGPMKVSTLSFFPFIAALTTPSAVPFVSYILKTISIGFLTRLYLNVFRTNEPADLFSPVNGSKSPT